MIHELEHIPKTGEVVEQEGYRFVIDQMDKNRISMIHIYRIPDDTSSEDKDKDKTKNKD